MAREVVDGVCLDYGSRLGAPGHTTGLLISMQIWSSRYSRMSFNFGSVSSKFIRCPDSRFGLPMEFMTLNSFGCTA